ncbi:unnamed protein product [Rotaria sp. Silwood1]|nr:unnamed protein product [Rotaria sp. Silwood1]
MFCSISSHELSAKQQCFRIQQSTKTCPNMCSPIQVVYDIEIPLKNGQLMDVQIINGRSMQTYQAHVKQKSLFDGFYCCKSNSVNRINYAQAHQYQ